ncbi:MAG: glycine/betaine ABC transporter substrate-binding protein, partial [Rhodospirillales bacterium]|nr:glycine/betaine ABC transporter substrate-binding protein [Rhodospirillales bacterium]
MTTGLCAATLMAMGAAGTAQADSDEPILITMNNWTSQNVLAYVTGNLLAK